MRKSLRLGIKRTLKMQLLIAKCFKNDMKLVFSNAGVLNLWYAYHWWFAEAFQMVREIFSENAKRIVFTKSSQKLFCFTTEIIRMKIG